VHHFGVSNFTPAQFEMLSSRLPATPLVTNQVELNPLFSDVLSDGTFDQCLKYRVKPMVWSPLRPLYDLKENRHGQEADKLLKVNEVLTKIANEIGVSEDKVALAWVLQHPSSPIPVIGTSNTARIQSAAEALDVKLTRPQWYQIWCASVGREDVP